MPWTDHVGWLELIEGGGLLDSLASFFTMEAQSTSDLNAWNDTLIGSYIYMASLSPDDFNTWLDLLEAALEQGGTTPINISDLLDSLQAWFDSADASQDLFARPSADDFAAWLDVIAEFGEAHMSVRLYDANIGWVISESGRQ